MALQFLKLNVLFLDLGNTLVTRDGRSGKFVQFPETDKLLNNLENKGIEMGIISDGNRPMLDSLLDDPSFLDRFKAIVA